MDVEKLKDQLILHEGLELKSYQCSAGFVTLGVGRNVEELGITEDEARYLLDNDILRVCQELDNNLPWWRNLSEVRQRIFVDMVFNLGISRFLNFKNMIAAAESEDWEEAAAQMLDSRWADQVGQRAHRLAKSMIEDTLEV
jgi:lysozyme